MQPTQPGGIPPTHAQPQRKPSGSGAGLLLLIGGLGCLGLIGVAGAVALGFFLVGRSAPEPDAWEYVSPEPWEKAPPALAPAGPMAPAGDDVERYRVPIEAHDPTRGPSDALVTIVEIGDFQCPFCARASATLDELERSYPGQIRVVWKDNPLPFHTDAMPAALAAAEARAQQGEAGFWRMHAQLFASTRALSRADLERYARDQGLDLGRFRAALDLATHSAGITADQQLAARIGATGTPTFYVNGRPLRGAQPLSAFQTLVDDELGRARRLEAAGTPRSQIYDQITRNGLTAAAPREPSDTVGARPTEEDPDRVYRVPVGDSPQRGPDDALVTIVAFSDFQCPFCSRVTATLDQVEQHYGRDVRIVFKHNPLPFHRDAMPAAQAAVEVYRQRGDDAFWRMHDLLFENQRALSEADLVRYGRQAGASGTGIQRALRADAHRAEVQREMDLATELGARGTPSFFINGKKLVGAQPFESFRAVVDRELAAALARVAAGTPRDGVYEAIIERAR